MNYDQFSRKSCLEINRQAQEQEKFQHQMQAAWAAETKPARIQSGIKAFFARLQNSLPAFSRLAPAAAKNL